MSELFAKKTIALTLIFEALTCLFRFGFALESTRDTAFLSTLTFGWRIHHSYIGLVILLALLAFRKRGRLTTWFACLAWALIFSDLIHHFLVLWPITGDPQFHWRY